MKLGDKEIDYNQEFKLYLTTKLGNPHYPPEVSTKTTIVNFAIKREGLEDQLLGILVKKERPDLEEQNQMLVVQVAKGKNQLAELEDKILYLLSSATGSLLDDDELVVAGLQTGGEAGCTAVTDIESQPGYLLEIDIVGTPAAGDEYTIVFDANDPLQAEVRFENLGSSIAEVSTGEGALTIVDFDPQATLQVTGFTTTLNGGSVIIDGDFTACPCDRIPE